MKNSSLGLHTPDGRLMAPLYISIQTTWFSTVLPVKALRHLLPTVIITHNFRYKQLTGDKLND